MRPVFASALLSLLLLLPAVSSRAIVFDQAYADKFGVPRDDAAKVDDPVTSGEPQPRAADANKDRLASTLHKKLGKAKWTPVPENEKYFHEAKQDGHYDRRFFNTLLPENERKQRLRALIQTYHIFIDDIGAESWLMHGTLMGWHWNRQCLPWDNDLDVMVMEHDMRTFASHHNMTLHHFELPPAPEVVNPYVLIEQEPQRRGVPEQYYSRTPAERAADVRDAGNGLEIVDYLLDVNPGWTNGSVKDRGNYIDARWIDTKTGLYIDITTLRRNPKNLDDSALTVKDTHHYTYEDIFPLRREVFEGVPAYVPFSPHSLLAEEYGRASLTRSKYKAHSFDWDRKEWIPIPTDTGPSQKKHG